MMKRLVVIDPNVTSSSPSMRAWLSALPAFRHLFDSIEVWATQCEIPIQNGVTVRRFPQRMPHSILHGFDFERRVSAYQKSLGAMENTLVQTTGCYVPKADIRYLHYWNRAMLEERAKRPATFVLHPVHRLAAELAARREDQIANMDQTRWWWVVSRSLAERIERQAVGGTFRVLPNQYDASRFNDSVAPVWRDKMRDHYGFAPDEFILVFSAYGHFERKGLMQAVMAINDLQERGHKVRLLVLGGTERTRTSFKKKLASRGIPATGCVFAGLVDNIERHLVAADGLFFPSHFEAFSLAEIESAALGLRLYLTPHYGTEMILREPANGRLLPWEPNEMAEVIGMDIKNGIPGTRHSEMGEAISAGQYQAKLTDLYREAIDSK